MKIKRTRRIILISLIIFLNIICDQISKSIIRNKINNNKIVNIINDNLVFQKAENSGAAMGLGSNLPTDLKTIYFQLLPIIFLLFLYRMIIIETELSKLTVIGIAFAIGGGIGNIFDRIAYGTVTDFILIKFGVFKTGIFNIADVSIIIGIFLAFLGIILSKNDSYKKVC